MQNSNEKTTLQQGFDLFMRKCKVNNLASASLKSYEQKLSLFLKFKGKDALLSEISADVGFGQ